MAALLKNPLAYLTTSFALFLIGLPLISIGTTGGPRLLLWIGLAALCIGALIPPVQRLCCAPKDKKSGAKADDPKPDDGAEIAEENENRNAKEAQQ